MKKNDLRFKILLLLSAAALVLHNLFQPREIIFLRDFIYLPQRMNLSRPLNEKWIPLESLEKDDVNLLIDIEDKYFYKHGGFSPSDVQSALVDHFVLGKKMRGASTLTQQLSRTLFLSREKTARRKLEEIELAMLLEKNLSKDMILELYLNTVYWGHGIHGLYPASEYYFNARPENLTNLQLKILFSILNRPDKYTREDILELYNRNPDKEDD